MRGFDLTPVLFATVALFTGFATFQFLHDLPGAHNGLLLFEKTCPIYSHVERMP